jgi:hypothetical protein
MLPLQEKKGGNMELWIEWWNQVSQLRPAFSRTRTFIWFAVALAATCVRGDLLGVTSLVRAMGLQERCYDRLLDWFHSRALNLDALTRLWTRLILSILKPFFYTVQGRIVFVADGIKIAKTGRKMPAVKKLHQESDNNTKPEFIFGHSCQAIGLIVRAASSFLADPLGLPHSRGRRVLQPRSPVIAEQADPAGQLLGIFPSILPGR